MGGQEKRQGHRGPVVRLLDLDHKVVGSNPTQVTADFTMTRISIFVLLLNHNFLICKIHYH